MVNLVICKTCTKQTLDYGKCYNCGGATEGCRHLGEYRQDACPACLKELVGSHCRECEAIPMSIRLSDGFQNPPAQPSPKSLEGRFDNVGNCLEELIPDWAVANKKGCKCKDIKKTLNLWGTEKCEENFDWIVQKMTGQRKYLKKAFQLIPKSVSEGGVRWLVKRAIEMSKEQK